MALTAARRAAQRRPPPGTFMGSRSSVGESRQNSAITASAWGVVAQGRRWVC